MRHKATVQPLLHLKVLLLLKRREDDAVARAIEKFGVRVPPPSKGDLGNRSNETISGCFIVKQLSLQEIPGKPTHWHYKLAVCVKRDSQDDTAVACLRKLLLKLPRPGWFVCQLDPVFTGEVEKVAKTLSYPSEGDTEPERPLTPSASSLAGFAALASSSSSSSSSSSLSSSSVQSHAWQAVVDAAARQQQEKKDKEAKQDAQREQDAKAFQARAEEAKKSIEEERKKDEQARKEEKEAEQRKEQQLEERKKAEHDAREKSVPVAGLPLQAQTMDREFEELFGPEVASDDETEEKADTPSTSPAPPPKARHGVLPPVPLFAPDAGATVRKAPTPEVKDLLDLKQQPELQIRQAQGTIAASEKNIQEDEKKVKLYELQSPGPRERLLAICRTRIATEQEKIKVLKAYCEQLNLQLKAKSQSHA